MRAWVASLQVTRALLTQALREGMLVKALVWPPLMVGLVLVLVAAAVGLTADQGQIAVQSSPLAAELQAADLHVQIVADPRASVQRGDADVGIWRGDDDAWVVGAARQGGAATRAEAVLRDHVGANWRLQSTAPQARSTDLDTAAGGLTALLVALCTLFAGVLGVAMVVRGREDGSLEAEGALPLPRWALGLPRVLAGAAMPAASLAAGAALLDALLGLPAAGQWANQGAAACVAAAALGVMMAGHPGRGFPAAFSRALTVVTFAGGAGLVFPAVAPWLPIASVSSLLTHTPAGLAVWPVTLSLVALAARAVRPC